MASIYQEGDDPQRFSSPPRGSQENERKRGKKGYNKGLGCEKT